MSSGAPSAPAGSADRLRFHLPAALEAAEPPEARSRGKANCTRPSGATTFTS